MAAEDGQQRSNSSLFDVVKAVDGERKEYCALPRRNGAKHGDLLWLPGYTVTLLCFDFQGFVACFWCEGERRKRRLYVL
jgi:hypothetical protein